jgi:hypothetical protein
MVQKLTRRTAAFSVLGATMVLAGCERGASTDRGRGALIPAAVDTIARQEDGSIGLAADMTVAPDGKLWIADASNHTLMLFDPRSTGLRSITREGDGPGELRGPQALSANSEGISVLQPLAARLSRFALDGSFLESRTVPAGALIPVALAADSMIAYPSLGLDESLVARVDLHTGERSLLGRALADRPGAMSMSSLRDQALRGEYPVEFQNNVFTVVAPDGRVWAISQYTGAITAYGPGGDTAWASALEPDAVERAHSAYFAGVRENPDRIQVPSLVADAELVGAELWISISDGSTGSTLRRFDRASGEPRGRIDLPGIGGGPFAVSPDGARLYVIDSHDAVLVSVSLAS